jgi:hypothetical protein
MDIDGVAERPEIVAVAQSADHINHVETHRRGADIRAPGLILPADRDAGAPVGLVLLPLVQAISPQVPQLGE